MNLAEFYYKSAEKYALDTVETWYLLTRRSSMIIVPPDEDVTRQAARLKIKYRNKLSLADCFAISTAINNRSILITTDIRIKEVKEIDTVHIKFNHNKR